ncbi:MAG: hypothetical protein QME77_11910, partial [bacterium]|nr:hypothetical protein [bacterium]
AARGGLPVVSMFGQCSAGMHPGSEELPGPGAKITMTSSASPVPVIPPVKMLVRSMPGAAPEEEVACRVG